MQAVQGERPVSLDVKPVFRVTLAKRTASSSCCGAKLRDARGPGEAAPLYVCVACGNACDRVLSDPEEVTAGG
jgi:hypothetical protein